MFLVLPINKAVTIQYCCSQSLYVAPAVLRDAHRGINCSLCLQHRQTCTGQPREGITILEGRDTTKKIRKYEERLNLDTKSVYISLVKIFSNKFLSEQNWSNIQCNFFKPLLVVVFLLKRPRPHQWRGLFKLYTERRQCFNNR